MTYEDAIKFLETQKWKIDHSGLSFEAWLDATQNYINDIFGTTSTQAFNFNHFKSDYSISKIGIFDNAKMISNLKTFRQRADDHLQELILYLKEKQKLDIKKQEREQSERKVREEQEKQQPKQKPISPPIASKSKTEKMLHEEKKHYTIGIGLFWTVVPIIGALMGFLYYLGNENGKAKFDQEKNNLYEENRTLKIDLSKARDSINLIPKSIYDSLSKKG